tara:strand:+ start:628 stop:915 length:288 start_codon:yes stop_codon:yes gene_type:complete
MMRGFRDGSKLGKCTFCSQAIQEGNDKLASKHAKITFGKWICGSCLYGMKDAVNAVVDVLDKEMEESSKTPTFKVDPMTGKINYKYPVALDETGE